MEIVPYRERLIEKFGDPELLNDICGHVANGGTLITLAKSWDLRYSDLTNWIRQHPDRAKRYDAAINDRAEWAKERVLHEMRQICQVDIRDAFNEDGSVKPIHEIPAEVAAAIASIDIDELFEGFGKERERVGETKKLKFWNKLDALHKYGSELGLFVQKHKIEMSTKLEDILEASHDVTPAAEPESPAAPPVNILPAEIIPPALPPPAQ